jgi:hypothetical protein
MSLGRYTEQEQAEYVESFQQSALKRFGVSYDVGEALDWLEADVTVDDAMEFINRGCGPGDAAGHTFEEAFPEEED